MNFQNAYKDKTVLVTGHTGFKGSWLCEWLLMLGANVVGYSLEPNTTPSHFEELGLSERLMADIRGDVRSFEDIQKALREHTPDFVFHLAAQPLVGLSYDEPLETIEINLNGTLNLLEAVRRENNACILILVTTDKVYRNNEWAYAYREVDPLGGYDPYSASKACADIVIASYQQSFFNTFRTGEPRIAAASVRGGNVIGGGDWADARIVPDCMRSLQNGETIPVRNRHATRPWQHVLELLSGYMHLGAELARADQQDDVELLQTLCSAFNFGPHITSNRSVKVLVEEVLKHWSGDWEDFTDPDAKHEAGKLNLTIDKAYHTLHWQPRWNFEETIRQTVAWYKQFYDLSEPDAEAVRALTRGQIEDYAKGLSYG